MSGDTGLHLLGFSLWWLEAYCVGQEDVVSSPYTEKYYAWLTGLSGK